MRRYLIFQLWIWPINLVLKFVVILSVGKFKHAGSYNHFRALRKVSFEHGVYVQLLTHLQEVQKAGEMALTMPSSYL